MAARFGEVAHGARGFTHQVLSLDGDLSAAADLRARVAAEPFVAGRGRPDQLGLRQRIVESSADLLCTYGSGALDAALANAAGPGLGHIHQYDESEEMEPAGAARLRNIAAAGALIVFSGPGAAKRAAKSWRIPKGRIRFVLPGVNTKAFRPFPGRADDGELVTVGFIGDLAHERMAQALVHAFVKMRARSAAQFAIYGEGAARPAAESLARAMGARGRLFFRSLRKALPAVYDELDIFISAGNHPSADRLIEAMACGLPVIGEAQGEAPVLLSRENLPLLASPGDVEGLSRLLGRLVNDAALRHSVGRANAAKARDEFSLAQMVRTYVDIYHEAAG